MNVHLKRSSLGSSTVRLAAWRIMSTTSSFEALISDVSVDVFQKEEEEINMAK